MSNDLMSKKQQAPRGLVVFLFIALIIADLLIKSLTADVYRNYYFAFSLPLNIYFMYGIYFAGITSIVVYLARHMSRLSAWEAVAWIMVLAGAVSNVGERMVLGYVRDWVYILNGVFNLADIYILAGILILIFVGKSSTKY